MGKYRVSEWALDISCVSPPSLSFTGFVIRFLYMMNSWKIYVSSECRSSSEHLYAGSTCFHVLQYIDYRNYKLRTRIKAFSERFL